VEVHDAPALAVVPNEKKLADAVDCAGVIKALCEGGRIPQDGTFRHFLLPSQSITGTRTSSFPVHLKYGLTVHLLVTYLGEDVLKQRAFLHCQDVTEHQTNTTPQQRELNATFWRKFTGLAPFTSATQDGIPREWKNIPLCESIRKNAGHAVPLVLQPTSSTQRNLALDRQFVHNVIDKFLNRDADVATIESVTIYVPSSLLESGIELVDCPGLFDQDSMTDFVNSHIMEQCDTLVVMLGNAASGAMFDMMNSSISSQASHMASTFLRRLVNEPQHYRLVLVHNKETTNNVFDLLDDDERSQSSTNRETIVQGDRSRVRDMLRPFASTEQQLDTVMTEAVSVNVLYMALFTSLQLNKAKAMELMKTGLYVSDRLPLTRNESECVRGAD
jgi:hypothetical protein